jgi:hypothetical protein
MKLWNFLLPFRVFSSLILFSFPFLRSPTCIFYLYLHLSIYLSLSIYIHMCVCIYIYIYILIYQFYFLYVSLIFLSDCLFIYPSMYLSYSFVSLLTRLPIIYLSIYLSVYLPIHLFIYLPVCLSRNKKQNIFIYVEYVLTEVTMKSTVLWVVTPCHSACRLHLAGFLLVLLFDSEDGGDMFLQDVDHFSNYTALQATRPQSSNLLVLANAPIYRTYTECSALSITEIKYCITK